MMGGKRNFYDSIELLEFGLDRIGAFSKGGVHYIYDDDLFFIKPQGFVLKVIYLAKTSYCGHNQGYRHAKLKDHQQVPEA